MNILYTISLFSYLINIVNEIKDLEGYMCKFSITCISAFVNIYIVLNY